MPCSLPSEIDDFVFDSSERSAVTSKMSGILDPGAKPANMIVGRESRSGIAAVSGPGRAECLPAGRIAPLGLPENALDVAGRNTAAAPGFFRGCGGRAGLGQRLQPRGNIQAGTGAVNRPMMGRFQQSGAVRSAGGAKEHGVDRCDGPGSLDSFRGGIS